MGFPEGSVAKNLPTMQETQETWVQSPGGEDPLEESVETHSSVLAWRIPRQRSLAGCSPRVAGSRTRPSDLALGQLVHLAVQQRLTQHGKAAMLQWKLILKNI